MDRLSRRASEDSSGQDSSYFIGWKEYERNPYHPSQNPTGIIQMGLAENELSFDLIEAWLELNEDSVGLRRNGKSLFKQLALFQDYHGLPAFKKELTDFMARIRGNQVKLDPNNLVLTAGATSANEILILCLADPGQAFLLPTPYYPGFDRDLQWRTGVKIVPVHCSSSNGFRITMSAMEEAYRQAEKLKLTVKGVLMTNPSNPLGRTMNLEEINDVINFATTKEIHVVSDEIYSGTVYEPPCFVSISEALMEENLRATDISKRVHIVYSLSKDLGLPGFRAGMIYSDNERVVTAATKMSSFSLVSSQTQYLLSQILSDEKFMRKLMKKTKSRIRKRKEMLVRGLKRAGVHCLNGNGGLFCWVDMRDLLRSDSFKAEEEMWESILRETGVNISAGSSCHCSEPGWFRICFANMSEETLLVAIHRLQSFIAFIRSSQDSAIHKTNRENSIHNKDSENY